MAKVLLTLHGRSVEPALPELLQELRLRADEVDVEYGVQPIDPAAGDYVILVEESAARRIDPDQAGVSGPYSDAVIETFGPPEG
ncbi:MAG: hypothetical protein BMS9Abin32_362 [Gammaproteobacteria bacterium]|nr:MAG: hypothetical protein BMS9Abin32_362 [Gammaproteobacteria bacterium]